MEKFKVLVSKYPNIYKSNCKDVMIINELNLIKSSFYQNEINRCRSYLDSGNIENYTKSKLSLPAVSFSGKFKGAHKAENLISYSGFIVIDIDKLMTSEITEIKNKLASDEFVSAIWTSPSGNGLKLLIQVSNNADKHKDCFDVLVDYFENKYQMQIDKSGSDICRLCFLSADDNVIIKTDASVFVYTNHISNFVPNGSTKKNEQSGPVSKTVSKKSKLDYKRNLYSTENRNHYKNRVTISKIIRYLQKNDISITETYNDWFRVACAIANSFTYDLGLNYYLQLCRLDKEGHDEYKSKNLLEYCYRNRRINEIEFSTIVFLVQSKGFNLKTNRKN